MNYIKRLCLIVAATVALSFAFVAPSVAQLDEAETLNKRVIELYQAGKYADAIPLAQRVLAIREQALGPNHPDVASSLNILANNYYAQSRYADAERLYKRAIDIREKTLGPDHPDIAIVLNNLAGVYRDQNRHADAESLYKRVLTIREKALGPDHPNVARGLNNLAQLLQDTNRLAEAEPLMRRALTIDEKSFGPDHPTVAIRLNNLAALLKDTNRLAEAEPLMRRALTIDEKSFGLDHPNVARGLNNLALLLKDINRLAEAEPLMRRALTIDEKSFGLDHPNVAIDLNNLAQLLKDTNRLAEAEPLMRRALTIAEKSFDPNHPSVARGLNNLAQLLQDTNRLAEAEPLMRRALTIDEKSFGPDHPTVAIRLNNLAALLKDTNRLAEAEPLMRRALTIDEKSFGLDHPNVARGLNNLALLLKDINRLAEAEPLMRRALTIDEKSFGLDHPNVAIDLNNLAQLLKDTNRLAEAEPLMRRALTIAEKSFDPNHPSVARGLNNLAQLLQDTNRLAEAEPLMRRALTISEKSFGPDHPTVAIRLNNLAALYRSQARYSDALPLVRRLISEHRAVKWIALSVLLQSRGERLIDHAQALDGSYKVIQRVSSSAAAEAVSKLAARFAAGTSELASRVRMDQDLTVEAEQLDKSLFAAISKAPTERNASAEEQIYKRIEAIKVERERLQAVFNQRFPDYVALSRPLPVSLQDTQALLAEDEALIVFDFDAHSYAWVITRSGANWFELKITAQELAVQVRTLRESLTSPIDQPFDAALAHTIYQATFGVLADQLAGKKRLSVFTNGALTSLPPQLLVTSDPTGKKLKEVDWLVRSYAITILPSVASLKVLRGGSATSTAPKPMIAFADPVFSKKARQQAQLQQQFAMRSITEFYRGTELNTADLAERLPQLPGTKVEVEAIGMALNVATSDIYLGLAATETAVKQAQLAQYRIVYFATHGLVAGEVQQFTKKKAEPALVFTMPDKPTELDDGLLQASEVAQLKLNADWVVLSACNTAAEDKPGAEALSGLARAFFYAGARSLIVSHWPVSDEATATLMSTTFRLTNQRPDLSHAEVLQQAMLQMINEAQTDAAANPLLWAPFVVVGEPAKLAK